MPAKYKNHPKKESKGPAGPTISIPKPRSQQNAHGDERPGQDARDEREAASVASAQARAPEEFVYALACVRNGPELSFWRVAGRPTDFASVGMVVETSLSSTSDKSCFLAMKSVQARRINDIASSLSAWKSLSSPLFVRLPPAPFQSGGKWLEEANRSDALKNFPGCIFFADHGAGSLDSLEETEKVMMEALSDSDQDKFFSLVLSSLTDTTLFLFQLAQSVGQLKNELFLSFADQDASRETYAALVCMLVVIQPRTEAVDDRIATLFSRHVCEDAFLEPPKNLPENAWRLLITAIERVYAGSRFSAINRIRLVAFLDSAGQLRDRKAVGVAWRKIRFTNAEELVDVTNEAKMWAAGSGGSSGAMYLRMLKTVLRENIAARTVSGSVLNEETLSQLLENFDILFRDDQEAMRGVRSYVEYFLPKQPAQMARESGAPPTEVSLWSAFKKIGKSAQRFVWGLFDGGHGRSLSPEDASRFLDSVAESFPTFLENVSRVVELGPAFHDPAVRSLLKREYTFEEAQRLFNDTLVRRSALSALSDSNKWRLVLNLTISATSAAPRDWMPSVRALHNGRWRDAQQLVSDAEAIAATTLFRHDSGLAQAVFDFFCKPLLDAAEDVDALLEYAKQSRGCLPLSRIEAFLKSDRLRAGCPCDATYTELRRRFSVLASTFPSTRYIQLLHLQRWMSRPECKAELVSSAFKCASQTVQDIERVHQLIQSEAPLLLSLQKVEPALKQRAAEVLETGASSGSPPDSLETLTAAEQKWAVVHDVVAALGDEAVRIWRVNVVERKSRLFSEYVALDKSGGAMAERICTADTAFKQFFGGSATWSTARKISAALKKCDSPAKVELAALVPSYETRVYSLDDLESLVDERAFAGRHYAAMKELFCGVEEHRRVYHGFQFLWKTEADCILRDLVLASKEEEGASCGGTLEVLRQFLNIFCVELDGVDPLLALNVLRFLSHLPKGASIWSFFQEHGEFVDATGAGYTTEFNTIVDVLHYELRDENQKLFETFRSVGYYIAALMGCSKRGTLRGTIDAILAQEQFCKTLQQTANVSRCLQSIAAVDERMAEIATFFTYGAGGLDTVQRQCECISKGMEARIALSSGELSVFFAASSEGKQVVEELRNEELNTFIQRAEFISTKNTGELSRKAKICVSEMNTLQSSISMLQELYVLGEPQFSKPVLHVIQRAVLKSSLRDGDASQSMRYSELDGLNDVLANWKQFLRREMKATPHLSLYFVSEARYMLTRLREAPAALPSLLYPALSSEHVARPAILSKDRQWTAVLKDLLQRTSSPVSLNPTPVSAAAKGGRQLLCTTYVDVLGGLAEIYDTRAPAAFELLWCEQSTPSWLLEQFLLRAQQHPQYRFTLIHVDRLAYSAVLSLYLQLQSLSGDAAANLDLIETEGNSATPAVFQRKRVNGDGAMKPLSDALSAWDLVQPASSSPSGARRCYVGPPGSGKSYMVKRDAAAVGPAQRCSIVIHEGFTVSTALAAIRRVVEANPSGSIFIGIEVSIGLFAPASREKALRWLEGVNKFLFDLLVCRSIHDVQTGEFLILDEKHIRCISVELPYSLFVKNDLEERRLYGGEWFPLVAKACRVVRTDTLPFTMEGKHVRLGRFLKAYDEGTIDTLCTPPNKRVAVVLDISGSMSGGKLTSAKEAIKSFLRDFTQVGDDVCVYLFNHEVSKIVSLQPVNEFMKQAVASQLAWTIAAGGTMMWTAILAASRELHAHGGKNQWIVVFSDGASDGSSSELQSCPPGALAEQSVVFMGVELPQEYAVVVSQGMKKFSKSHVFFSASASDGSIKALFAKAGECVSVSRFISEKYAAMSLSECEGVVGKHLQAAGCTTQLQRHFWLQYMLRRCDLLESSDQFNLNEKHKSLGSVTMRTMLDQVKLAVSTTDHVAWTDSYHEEMIYWRQRRPGASSDSFSYSWSIFAVDPTNSKGSHWETTRKNMKAAGMHLPPSEDLRRCDVLQSYVAHALHIPLPGATLQTDSTGAFFDFPIGCLPDDGFVWTEDFALKMIRVNERIACGVPCVLVGETGVSKTALLDKIFKLKNQQFCSTDSVMWRSCRCGDREEAFEAMREEWGAAAASATPGSAATPLPEWLMSDPRRVQQEVRQELMRNPILSIVDTVQRGIESGLATHDSNVAVFAAIVDTYLSSADEVAAAGLKALFHVVNVHGSMTVGEIEAEVQVVVARAEALLKAGEALSSDAHRQLKICVFFDEMNTSAHMGLLKEIVEGRCMNGVPLPPNVVPIAAVNPYREKLLRRMGREEEQGEEWLSGHYNVQPLPPSLQSVAWNYGTLSPSQEREFIRQYAAHIGELTEDQVAVAVDHIDFAHQLVRQMAKEYMRTITRAGTLMHDASEVEYAAPALSLRDIIRCFSLFKFFLQRDASQAVLLASPREEEEQWKTSLLLSVALTYYLRLVQVPSKNLRFRSDFAREYKLRTGADIEETVSHVVAQLGEATAVPPRIAKTRGLVENLYACLVCILARQPVLIIGAPGTSKTLAVTILLENAKGGFSGNAFYRSIPELKALRYQCSRKSTSTQIATVFDLAIMKQETARDDRASTQWFVFMDEAGLPEEERESLKILHFYLEGGQMRKTGVGFVAISNHVLDAAKSNRCAIISRCRPDLDELLTIARESLCAARDFARIQCALSGTKGRMSLVTEGTGGNGFLNIVCRAFHAAMEHSQPRPADTTLPPPPRFNDFFGHRDFIAFVKHVGRLALARQPHEITEQVVRDAVQSSLNGQPQAATLQVVNFFLDHMKVPLLSAATLENPVKLFASSFHAPCPRDVMREGRYYLVIDPTSNDTIFRELPQHMSVAEAAKVTVLKLSNFPSDASARQAAMAGAMCLHASDSGDAVLASNSDAIHESFYNLFNKHFSESTLDGKKVYRTEVAIGTATHLIRVRPEFQTVVHVTLEQLAQLPAPFLDRFEKYQWSLEDVLQSTIAQTEARDTNLHRLLGAITKPVQRSVERLIDSVGRCAFFGVVDSASTAAAVLTAEYRRWATIDDVANMVCRAVDSDAVLKAHLTTLLGNGSDGFTLLLNVAETVEKMCSRDDVDAWWTGVVVAATLQRRAICQLFAVAVPEVLLSRWEALSSSTIIDELLSLSPAFESPCFASSASKRQIFFTRAISNPHLDGVRVVHFAELASESAFEDTLGQHWKAALPLVFLIDTRRTPVTQINFARSAIDAKFESAGECQHPITLVVQVASSELPVYHLYNVTFTSAWREQFFDDLRQTPETLTWLKYAYAGGTNVEELHDALRRRLHGTAARLARVLRKRTRAAPGRVEEEEAVSEAEIANMLGTTVGSETLGAHLVSHFATFTAGEEEGHQRPFMQLVEDVKGAVKLQASGTVSGSIGDIVSQSVCGIFDNFVLHYCALLLDCMGESSTLFATDAETSAIIERGLKHARPTMHDMRKPLQPVTVEIPSCAEVPFMRIVMRHLDAATSVSARDAGEDGGADSAAAALFRECYGAVRGTRFASMYLRNVLVSRCPRIEGQVVDELVQWLERRAEFEESCEVEGDCMRWFHSQVCDTRNLKMRGQLWTAAVLLRGLVAQSQGNCGGTANSFAVSLSAVSALAFEALACLGASADRVELWIAAVDSLHLDPDLEVDEDAERSGDETLTKVQRVLLAREVAFMFMSVHDKSTRQSSAALKALEAQIQFVATFGGSGNLFLKEYWEFLTASHSCKVDVRNRYALAAARLLTRSGYETLYMGDTLEVAAPHSFYSLIQLTLVKPSIDVAERCADGCEDVPPFYAWLEANVTDELEQALENSASFSLVSDAAWQEAKWSGAMAFFLLAWRYFMAWSSDGQDIDVHAAFKAALDAATRFSKAPEAFSIVMQVVRWFFLSVAVSQLEDNFEDVACLLEDSVLQDEFETLRREDGWTALFVGALCGGGADLSLIARLSKRLVDGGAPCAAASAWVKDVETVLSRAEDHAALEQRFSALQGFVDSAPAAPQYCTEFPSEPQYDHVLDATWTIPLLYRCYRTVADTVLLRCATQRASDVVQMRAVDLMCEDSNSREAGEWVDACAVLQMLRSVWGESIPIPAAGCSELKVCDVASSITDAGVEEGVLLTVVRFLISTLNEAYAAMGATVALEGAASLDDITDLLRADDTNALRFAGYDRVKDYLLCSGMTHMRWPAGDTDGASATEAESDAEAEQFVVAYLLKHFRKVDPSLCVVRVAFDARPGLRDMGDAMRAILHSLSYKQLVAVADLVAEVMSSAAASVDANTTLSALLTRRGSVDPVEALKSEVGDLSEEQVQWLRNVAAQDLLALQSFCADQLRAKRFLFADRDLAVKAEPCTALDARLAQLLASAPPKSLEELELWLIDKEISISQQPRIPLYTLVKRSYASEARIPPAFDVLQTLAKESRECDDVNASLELQGCHYVSLRLRLLELRSARAPFLSFWDSALKFDGARSAENNSTSAEPITSLRSKKDKKRQLWVYEDLFTDVEPLAPELRGLLRDLRQACRQSDQLQREGLLRLKEVLQRWRDAGCPKRLQKEADEVKTKVTSIEARRSSAVDEFERAVEPPIVYTALKKVMHAYEDLHDDLFDADKWSHAQDWVTTYEGTMSVVEPLIQQSSDVSITVCSYRLLEALRSLGPQGGAVDVYVSDVAALYDDLAAKLKSLSFLDSSASETADALFAVAAQEAPTEASLVDTLPAGKLAGAVKDLESLLRCPEDARKIDEASQMLLKPPLRSWGEVALFDALINSLPCEKDFAEDAVSALNDYVDARTSESAAVHPLTWLAVARYALTHTTVGQDTIRLCLLQYRGVPYMDALLTTQERELAATDAFARAAHATEAPPAATRSKGASPEEQWAVCKDREAIKSSAMDAIMGMVGLTAAKREVLTLHQMWSKEARVPADKRRPQRYHFSFLGNPGTGKKVFAQRLGGLLFEAKIRSSAAFVVISGDDLQSDPDSLLEALTKADGGVVFIEDADAISPKTSMDGRAVVRELLKFASDGKANATVILAGEKRAMEENLFQWSAKMKEVFGRTVLFDDFDEAELERIFVQICRDEQWQVSAAAARIAARSVGRRRGHPGFANAAEMTALFDRAYSSAVARGDGVYEITTSDVLGPRPDVAHHPKLRAALEELDNMVGLDSVKAKIHALCDTSVENYDREMNGEEPRLPPVSGVFIGNPGTGKTTVAKLYGRILGHLGLLSNGESKLVTPEDLTGDVVGSTSTKTKTLMKECKGKVLIIDEAYGLHRGGYGKDAVDALVGSFDGAPGEDIAVIMVGYEKQMLAMLRDPNVNPGLSRRLGVESNGCFMFADYSDRDLQRILFREAARMGVRLSREFQHKATEILATQRRAPNFGNAGMVIKLMQEALVRMQTTDPSRKTLTVDDLEKQISAADALSSAGDTFNGLFRIDRIRDVFMDLFAIVSQCKEEGTDWREHITNYVFTGNPGTGKTTVARLIAKVLHTLGCLQRNVCVERTGLDLQGSFVGQTKDKVNGAMEEAQGGVLFIDEAYALSNHHGGSFSQEAIDQLVGCITSESHLHNTVVILAGYTNEMNDFLASNPGLNSRFTNRIHFEDWAAADCAAFLTTSSNFPSMTSDAKKALDAFLADAVAETPQWANGRDCKTIQAELVRARALRLSRSPAAGRSEEDEGIVAADVAAAARLFFENRGRQKPGDAERQEQRRAASKAFFDLAFLPQASVGPSLPRENCAEQSHAREEAKVEELEREEADLTDEELNERLQEACKQAGYDDSHERRIELVEVLTEVKNGGEFPACIIDPIAARHPGCSIFSLSTRLRGQVDSVMAAMSAAIRSEEERRERMRQLEEEARLEQQRILEKRLEKLRMMCLCPAGFSWHPENGGWRCNGGAHWVPDSFFDAL